jgi:hypothetical protein
MLTTSLAAFLGADFRWQARASCVAFPEYDWFSDVPAEIAACADICGACVVRSECLAFALAGRIRDGIWGGLTESQRAARPTCLTCRARPARVATECGTCQKRRLAASKRLHREMVGQAAG